MLVLRRLEGETIHIGEDIVITMCKGSRIGITAPPHINIRRSELLEQPRAIDTPCGSTEATGLSSSSPEDGSAAA